MDPEAVPVRTEAVIPEVLPEMFEGKIHSEEDGEEYDAKETPIRDEAWKKYEAFWTQIANRYMTCISDLGDIQKETQAIHRLGLSHIVATDLDTLISLVDTIRAEEDVLDGYLAEFEKYVEDDERANYEAILTNYEGIKYELPI